MSPEFSEKTKKKIEEIVARYPQKEAAILPVLHITQQEFGSISAEEEKLVARILGIKPISVREIVTFYTMLSRESLGKYHIQVCSNLSCSLLGAGNFVDYLVEKLGIEPGETTPDKKFTLSTVECLGACERAPCMLINFNYYGEMDPKKVDEILDGLK
ncbi:MAG TPA: NADH-quinone oxidoreductase subunit NuoE [Candidatus Aminicenantes bacterium]|jgi:NADH-quinone oxidoreductase subunit E|nr:NADH-quinone oxidoreductase subunit NuoE [Candidatus Aminicenantes bacterium]HEB35064.1 NADH-quinone oxidoreductase subunit NuoE [Candidatus Aminicenantes bacterium]